ncbi:MAG: VOC family protein [Bradymonadaceae bacterium]
MSDRTIQSIALNVRQLDPARRFYQSLVGLDVLSESEGEVVLGAGDSEIVRLMDSPDAPPRDGRGAGLFHLAVLLPDRRSLADALARLSGASYSLTGASDHDVSEALYTDDPADNGVELYCDRPESEWRRDASGEVYMTTRRLDLEGLRGQASPTTPERAPEGTSLGHVHLEVTDLERAVAFYRDALGMDLQASRRGAAFLSWDGYHHHVGLNTWNHRREPHDANALGLKSVTAALPPEDVETIRSRADERELALDNGDAAFSVDDPDGHAWQFRN